MSVVSQPLPTKSRAIIASPDSEFRSSVREALRSIRWQADEAQGGAEALFKLDSGECQALLVDSWLPDLNVGELVALVRNRHPQMEIVLLNNESEHDALPGAASSNHELIWAIRNAQPRVQDKEEITVPRTPQNSAANAVANSAKAAPLPGMIGESAAMQQIYRHARLIAKRDAVVLITGETGTGKELVAKGIHQLSNRATRQFMVLNCAAIPDTLIESELFGYNRGAFTGAVQSRIGRLQAADGGTLFLDEIGELSAGMQAKLLRFLEEGEVQRLGESESIHVDVRVIAATNIDLNSKTFREDLYYRLAVFPIELPPLRSRKEDLKALIKYFLDGFQQREGLNLTISPEAVDKLQAHNWPGNVRELRHVIERAAILASEAAEIGPDHVVLSRQFSEKL